MDFWNNRVNIYDKLSLIAQDILDAPASQAYVERGFSVCSLLTAGRRNRMTKSLQRWACLKQNITVIKTYRRQWHQQDSLLVCHLQCRRLYRARGHVLPFLQIAGNGGHQTPYQGFSPEPNWETSVSLITLPHTITEGLCPRQWVRNHRARGRTPTFRNSWARRTTWRKQKTQHTVLPAMKALAKITNCTRRAINLNNLLYKNKSGTLVAVG